MKKNPILLPNGDMIHGTAIASINHFVGSGVSIKGENGDSLSYVPEADDEKAKHIRSELIKVVMAVHNKEKYQPKFAMPKKDDQATTDQMAVKK